MNGKAQRAEPEQSCPYVTCASRPRTRGLQFAYYLSVLPFRWVRSLWEYLTRSTRVIHHVMHTFRQQIHLCIGARVKIRHFKVLYIVPVFAPWCEGSMYLSAPAVCVPAPYTFCALTAIWEYSPWLFTVQLLSFGNACHGEQFQRQERQQGKSFPWHICRSQSSISKPCTWWSPGECPVKGCFCILRSGSVDDSK